MVLVRMGWRLIRSGGRAATLRIGLLALGSALSCAALLSVLGVSQLSAAQDRTDRSIEPVSEWSEDTEVPESGLMFRTEADGWENRLLRRFIVSSVTDTTPAPPGVARLPGPGEVVMSPGLVELASREPLVAERFPQQLIGTIDDAGLATPNVLVAYVGVEAGQLRSGFVATGFGAQSAQSERDPAAARIVGSILGILVLVPVAVFLATCARLAANTRDQRLAALRLLGLSPRRTQVVNSVEIAVGSLAGATVGVVGFQLWTHTARSAQLAGFDWFINDMQIGIVTSSLIGVTLAALAVMVAVLSSQSSISEPLTVRREKSPRHIRPWRIVPLIVGIALLAVSWTTASETADIATWLLPFAAGLASTAIGIALAAPFVAIATGWVLQHVDRPSAMIAAARLRHDPTSGARLVAGLSVSVFALGFAFVVLQVFDIYDANDEFVGNQDPVVLTATTPPTNISDIQALSDIGLAAEARRYPPAPNSSDGDARSSGNILVATCDTARALTSMPLDDCVDGNTYNVTSPRYANNGPDMTPDGFGVTPYGYPEPAGTLEFDLTRTGGIDYTFLAPPSLPIPPTPNQNGDELHQTGTEWAVAYNGETFDAQRAVATLVSNYPGSFWTSGFTDPGPAAVIAIYEALVTIGALASIAIGLLALIIATIDRALERRREIARITALGAPRTTLRRVHLLQTLPVSMIVLATAGIASVLGGSSYLKFGGEEAGSVPTTTIATLVGLALLGAVTASLLGLIALTSRTDPAYLRDE